MTDEQIIADWLTAHCRCGRQLAYFIDQGIWACPFRWAAGHELLEAIGEKA